jgi:hypothetical protein
MLYKFSEQCELGMQLRPTDNYTSLIISSLKVRVFFLLKQTTLIILFLAFMITLQQVVTST